MQEQQEQQLQDCEEAENEAIRRAIEFLYTLIEIQMEQNEKMKMSA